MALSVVHLTLAIYETPCSRPRDCLIEILFDFKMYNFIFGTRFIAFCLSAKFKFFLTLMGFFIIQ